MKLILVFSVILALSLADDLEEDQPSNDLVAAATGEIQTSAESRYGYVPQTTAKPWSPPSNYNTAAPSIPSAPSSQNTYYPQNTGNGNTWDNTWNNQNTWNNPQNNVPSNSWNENNPQNTWGNQQGNWNNPQNTVPQNTWNKPQNTGSQNTWNKPQNSWNKPQNTWNKPQNTGSTNNWNNWSQAPTVISPTTTPISIIKNEQSMGENGSYKYEYEIADGTHVSEEGYSVNANTAEESIVKRGFYSFTAGDGKVYTVTYWADDTGFHAVGDHLPKPPPVPPAIQAAIDQNAKEEAAKQQQNNQQQQQQQQTGYYPQSQETPKPIVPQQPAAVPNPVQPVQQPAQYPQQTYYPQQQQTYYPPSNYYPPQAYGRR